MPKHPAPARTIKGHLPTATYTNKGLVQGASSNKTLDYLRELLPTDPGRQAFYREALNDIPHPLATGKTLTYGGLQDALNGPQRAAMLDAYAAANRLPRATAEQMQAAEYAAAEKRLLARAAANPDRYAFPDAADAARRAPNTATAIAHGNFVAPAGAAVQDAASLAQRYADQPTGDAVMAAPGTPVRLVRGAPRPAAPARIIPGTIATR